MPSKHNHPSQWRIVKANPKPGARRSAEYLLPTPQSELPLVISSTSANRILHTYSPDNSTKPAKAGIFATALKKVIDQTNDLTKLRGITLDSESTMREWLTIYEEACRAHSNGDMFNERPVVEEEPQTVNTKLHDEIVLACINGFAMHVGPIADPKLIATQAKAVAEAYGTL